MKHLRVWLGVFIVSASVIGIWIEWRLTHHSRYRRGADEVYAALVVVGKDLRGTGEANADHLQWARVIEANWWSGLSDLDRQQESAKQLRNIEVCYSHSAACWELAQSDRFEWNQRELYDSAVEAEAAGDTQLKHARQLLDEGK